MTTGAVKPRSLRGVVRALVGSVVGLAVVAALATALAEVPAVGWPGSAGFAACDAAERLGVESELKAEAATALFDRAGVTAENIAALGPMCADTWRSSQERASGLVARADLEAACADAVASLDRGEITKARVALAAAGVDSSNTVWLPTRCANAWHLVALPDAKKTVPDAAASALACTLARAQLGRGDAADSVATLKAVGGAAAAGVGTCSDVWAVASGLAPAPKADDESGAQAVGGAWDDFVTAFVTPLTTFGTFVLGGWLALIVLARILVEASFVRHLSSSTGSRRMARLLGWGVVLVTPLIAGWLAVAIARGALAPAWGVTALVAIGLVGVVGAASLACWLATLRKLDLDVTAGDTDVDKVQILETVRALAQGTGRNIELKSAPTLSDIDQTLGDLSKAQWVAVVQKIALFIIGVKPWKAVVTVISESEAFIVMGRNGRSLLESRVWTESPALAALVPSGAAPITPTSCASSSRPRSCSRWSRRTPTTSGRG